MRYALFLSALAILRGQGGSPRTKPADYPVHVQMDTVTLAAEYLVHSLPTAKATLVANDYLVVEVAFFGPPSSRLRMSPDNFQIKINGHGQTLPTEPAGMVAASIKNPRPSHLQTGASVGMGDGTVSVGPRPPPSQFPGDGNERTAPGQPPTVKSVEEENAVEYRVQNATLPEGEQSLPRSGLLYFYYRGRIKGIHSIDLYYEGPMGTATLKLLP